MRKLILAASVILASVLAAPAMAQEDGAKRAPSAKQLAARETMKVCNASWREAKTAKGVSGRDAYQAHMAECRASRKAQATN